MPSRNTVDFGAVYIYIVCVFVHLITCFLLFLATGFFSLVYIFLSYLLLLYLFLRINSLCFQAGVAKGDSSIVIICLSLFSPLGKSCRKGYIFFMLYFCV